MEKYDVIIIGGGPSGLMAAGQAATRGMKVLLLEKMKIPGRKLRITGKGRCNITNVATLKDFLSHIGPEPRFLYPAFTSFFSNNLIEFLSEIGIKTITERGGRVFPENEDAVEIAEAMVKWCKRNGVKILCEERVTEIMAEKNIAHGVKTESGKIFNASNIIISTGGASYPATGSTGDGYGLASMLGHKTINIKPVLVPFETEGDLAQKMQGLALKNIEVNVFVDGKKKDSAFGEMLFTHFGVSGPIILSLSRKIIDDVQQKKKVIFSIDLKPALDHEKLDARLLRDIDENGKKLFHNILRLLIPPKMISVFCQILEIPETKPVNQISSAERKKIRNLLKDFQLTITNHRSFAEAIVTSGGISLNEINPKTMESKLIKGLYFTGEVIDLDADTGGYNLQIAFSTGWLAGNSVS